MITPKLEDLIWKGKAFYKTCVVGGTQRQSLAINEDRFIIITDLTYFSSGHFPVDPSGTNNTWANLSRNGMNTQLTILGEKGVNRFLFRNSFVGAPHNNSGQIEHLLPVGSTKIDTYLLHTTNVGFAFSFAQDLTAETLGAVDSENYALQPPTDYGRNGQPGAINISSKVQVNGTAPYEDNFQGKGNTPGLAQSNEFSFPVDSTNDIPFQNRINSWAYPICHVNYIEIIGLPNNLQL
jgi:hypothetical protein